MTLPKAMLGIGDVLRLATRGPTLDELEACFPPTSAWQDAVDACVDAGLVRIVWRPRAPRERDRYRLSPRGRRLLAASASAAAAA